MLNLTTERNEEFMEALEAFLRAAQEADAAESTAAYWRAHREHALHELQHVVERIRNGY